MRTKEVIKGLKNSQKIRVIVDGVGIYMTVGEVESKFATTAHYQATKQVLETLAKDRAEGKRLHGWSGVTSGMATSVTVYVPSVGSRNIDVQVDIL